MVKKECGSVEGEENLKPEQEERQRSEGKRVEVREKKVIKTWKHHI